MSHPLDASIPREVIKIKPDDPAEWKRVCEMAHDLEPRFPSRISAIQNAMSVAAGTMELSRATYSPFDDFQPGTLLEHVMNLAKERGVSL